MTMKAKLALMTAIILWASAFIGIRIGLHGYSPQGMALLRFLVASLFMGIAYYRMPVKNTVRFQDACVLMALGGVSVGLYNLFLNYGELSVISGVASFVTSQSPIITAILAAIFLGERFGLLRVFGFMVSVSGTALMTMGEFGEMKWTTGMLYLLLATMVGSVYSLVQKPYLKKYHAIEATSYVIWGCALFLAVYFPHLMNDLTHASVTATLAVVYLGVFPAAVGYIVWAYALNEVPASKAMNFLYVMPFFAAFLGWLILGEIPVTLTIAGGMLAIFGVMIGNHTRHARR